MLHTANTLRVALLPVLEEPSRFGGAEGPDLTRYFVVCGTLLLVIGLLAVGFRRLLAGNLRLRAARRSLRILDVLPLGGKRRLAVVRCYDRTFVLGLGDHEITPITELDPVIGANESGPPPTKADRQDFARALDRARPALVPSAPAAAEKPARVTRKKIRRKKVRPPVAKAPVIDSSTETVAQAARRMASERKGTGRAPGAPLPGANPAPAPAPTLAEASVERLRGLIG